MSWIVKSIITSRQAIAFILCVLSIAAQAESSENSGLSFLKIDTQESQELKKFTGQWKFTIGGRGQTEGIDEGVASFITFRAKTQYKILQNLSIQVDPKLDFYSSQIQQRYEDDLYQSKIRLTNAFLKFSPIEFIDLKFGAHSQALLNQEMIIAERRVFPGFQQMAFFDTVGMRIEFMAQQLVPTSSSLNTERSEKEKMPGFFTESIKVSSLESFSPIQLEVQGGHYRWQGLSSKTTFQSKMAGNLQNPGESVANAKFRNGFDGYFGSLGGCWCAGERFDLSARFERIHNTLAPSYGADGQAWTLAPKIKFSDVDLSIQYWKFFLESEATVAEYVINSTAGTNRDGQEIRLFLDFKKLGFALETRWAQADPINNNNSVQKTITEYYLGLESHYVAF